MWLDALRADPEVATSLGLSWLGRDDAAALHVRWRELWRTSHWDAALVDVGLAIIDRCEIVAAGQRQRRLSGVGCDLLLVHDPARHQLALLPGVTFPPTGAILAGRGARDLRRSAEDLVRPIAPIDELTACARLVASIDIQDASQLLLAIEATEPWVDDGWWGSAHDDDPFGHLPPIPRPVDLTVARRAALDQDPARPESYGLRTLWSRSVVRLERHLAGMWVLDVRYLPRADPCEAFLPGAALPDDLPVDLVPTLRRADAVPGAHLWDQPPNPAILVAACALGLADPAAGAQVEPLASRMLGTAHQGAAVEILRTYGQDAVLASLGRRSAAARPAVEALVAGGDA
jgi:hypothetical protein